MWFACNAHEFHCQALICEWHFKRWSEFDDHFLFSICLTLSPFVLLAYFRPPKSVFTIYQITVIYSWNWKCSIGTSPRAEPKSSMIEVQSKPSTWTLWRCLPPDDIFIQASLISAGVFNAQSMAAKSGFWKARLVEIFKLKVFNSPSLMAILFLKGLSIESPRICSIDSTLSSVSLEFFLYLFKFKNRFFSILQLPVSFRLGISSGRQLVWRVIYQLSKLARS